MTPPLFDPNDMPDEVLWDLSQPSPVEPEDENYREDDYD